MMYRTRTREQYDWLMGKLEDENRRWWGGELPTELDGFSWYGEYTVIDVDPEDGYKILYFSVNDEMVDCSEEITEVSKLMDDFREEKEDEV